MKHAFIVGVVLVLVVMLSFQDSWKLTQRFTMASFDGDQTSLGALQHFRNRIGGTPSAHAWSNQGDRGRASDPPLTNHEERTSADAAAKYWFPHLDESEHAFDTVPDAIMIPSEIAMYRSEYGLLDAQGSALEQQQPLIYFITPTHKRDTQMVDLTRLGQTLMHDRGIYWIVIEDSVNCTRRVRNLLDHFGLMYAHVSVKSPKADSNPNNLRGVNQRNRGLSIVEELNTPGIVYFGDDDNAYDIRLFPELRRTKQVSVFGVGFTGGAGYERCLVNATTGKVSRLVSKWSGGRKFQMDMASFAFHSDLVLQRKPRFPSDCRKGHLETKFLEQLVESVVDLEPLCNNCTKIYVWHVKTKSASLSSVPNDPDKEKILNLIRT